MRFKVGDKVIVKSFSQMPRHWNDKEKMNKWMGKIVTIRSSKRNSWFLYAIEEDKDENNGYGWGWEESDFLPIPKPGDKVKFRTWEDLKKQYGMNSLGNIKCPHYPIDNERKKHCGMVCTVVGMCADYFRIEDDNRYWLWPPEIIDEVYPKEEKMEFTKDMLKNGAHVVTLRNDYRYLYLNNCFINLSSAIPLDYYSEDLKNTGIYESEYDVIAVYEARRYTCFNNIILNSDKLIWKRDEEPIEISATEAFAQLREIYGKEVKIVEDK